MEMRGPSLVDLPVAVLANVITFTPQQDTINLAQTNFKFYAPCAEKLYRRLEIRLSPALEYHAVARGCNFLGAALTVVAGFRRPMVKRQRHLELIHARLQILIEAITINHHLVQQYMHEIRVLGDDFGPEIEESIFVLFNQVRRQLHNLGRVFIENERIRRLVYDDGLPSSVHNLHLPLGENLVGRLQISEVSLEGRLDGTVFTNLRALQVRPPPFLKSPTSFWHTIRTSDVVLNLAALEFTFHHVSEASCQQDLNDLLAVILNHIRWESIQQLKMNVGCDDRRCGHKCVSEVLDLVAIKLVARAHLKLSVLQIEQCKHWGSAFNETHEFDVEWDLAVFGFLATLFSHSTPQVRHLTIVHKSTECGYYADGVEGNYLKRLDLYTATLSEILSSNVVTMTLSLPTFFATMANYEQPMNNLLWNGCKCQHCAHYLQVLDDFLMTHKYMRMKDQLYYWKDLTSCQLMGAIADMLSKRVATSGLSPRMADWDLHTNRFGLPFLCLQHKTFEEAEFEVDDDKEEVFFDAREDAFACFVEGKILLSDIGVCILHFLNDIVLRLLNLNRGDAEGLELGGDFENDGGSKTHVYLGIEINGIFFAVGCERNGTNWVSCLLD